METLKKGQIMVMIEFRSKEDKKHLLEKAKKMEEYASMIVDCIEESETGSEYNERHHDYNEDEDWGYRGGRYGYRRGRM